MYNNKQIGFVYQGNKVINKIVKNGELIHEKGFTRENTVIPPFHFKGVGSNLKKYSIKGNSIQNGTPTPDTPIDIESVGEPYNLFDISTITENKYMSGNIYDNYGGLGESSVSNISDYIPIDENTKYFLTYEYSSLLATTRRGYCFYDKDKNIIKSTTDTLNIITSKRHEISSPASAKYIRFAYDKNCTNIKFFNKYKIPVKTISHNLFDKNDLILNSDYSIDEEGFITATCDNSSGTNTKYVNIYGKNGCYLKENTLYKILVEIKNVEGTGILSPCSMLSIQNQGQFKETWDNLFDTLSIDSKIIRTIRTKISLTNMENGLRTLVYFRAGQSGSITFRISVLADTSITTDNFIYQPYFEKITNIYLNEPLRKIGDYVDYIDFDNKKVVRNIKKDYMLSSFNWLTYNNSKGLLYFLIIDPESKRDTPVISNRLINDDMWIATSGNMIKKDNKNDSLNILIEGITDLTTFKALLDEWESEGNPLYALLVLETPREENIELPDIETYEADTTLALDTIKPSEMYLKYKSKI
jgi:hypothetical protein